MLVEHSGRPISELCVFVLIIQISLFEFVTSVQWSKNRSRVQYSNELLKVRQSIDKKSDR